MNYIRFSHRAMFFAVFGFILIGNILSNHILKTSHPVELQGKNIIPTPRILPSPTPIPDTTLLAYWDDEKNIFTPIASSPGSLGNSVHDAGYKTPIFDRDTSDIYYIKDHGIWKQHIQTKESSPVYTPKDDIVQSLAKGPSPHTIIINTIPSEHTYSSEETLSFLDTSSGALTNIVTTKPVLYGQLKYEFSFEHTHVISSFGADSCAGWGSIVSKAPSSDKSTLITEIGDGCSEKPRYLGFDAESGNIILAAILDFPKRNPDDKNNIYEYDYWNPIYDVLYEKSVISGVVTPIFDLKKISFPIRHISWYPESQTVGIHTKDQYIMISTKKKTILTTTTASLPSEFIDTGSSYPSQDAIPHTHFAVQYGENPTLYRLDEDTGEFIHIPWPPSVTRHFPIFQGISEGKEIFLFSK